MSVKCVSCRHNADCAKVSRLDECEEYNPATNADRIRAMSDEELAEFFQNITFCDSCFIYKNECGTERYSCEQRWLDWLKEEVAE